MKVFKYNIINYLSDLLGGGLDCLVAGAFVPKRITLFLFGLPPSLLASISLSPASSIDFFPACDRKREKSIFFLIKVA